MLYNIFLFCLLHFSCQVVIKVCENANKLAVDDSTCSDCDARLMRVEYRAVIKTKFFLQLPIF